MCDSAATPAPGEPELPVMRPPTPEQLAWMFHDAYERLAPNFGYKTREASAVPWADVPEPNRSLMIAVAAELLHAMSPAFLLPAAAAVRGRGAADSDPCCPAYPNCHEPVPGPLVDPEVSR